MSRTQPIRSAPAVALALTLAFSACDSGSDLTGTDGDALALTQAALRGKILFFQPKEAAGGIPNWEYVFNAGQVTGCNIENVFQSTGWTVIDERTVRVIFGGDWEQYELVKVTGALADDDLRGSFNYTSSPGVSMTGTFAQVRTTTWC